MARRLTHRQLEVLELIAKGLTNTEIGRVLGISLGTVKSHVSAVIETLGASNRTEVAGMLAELELGRRAPQIAADEAVPGFGERPALAMLPFEDLGDAGESDWFARGVLSGGGSGSVCQVFRWHIKALRSDIVRLNQH